jgi:uncharacterized protein YkwD
MQFRYSPRGTFAIAVFLLAMFAAVVTAATSPPNAAAVVGDCTAGSDWGTSRPDLASDVVTRINTHRTSLGLVALNVSPTLTNAAVWKARHMARYSYMQHDDPAPPIARTVPDRLEACGYPSRTTGWGENIAYGYSTGAAVVQAWLNSPGHRANIENASYRSTGVGAATNASGVVYWSQEFGTYDDSGTGSPPAGSAPTVSLTGGPASSTTSTSASFTWTTSGTVSSTTCSLDGGVAVACTSPRSYSALAVGSHTFRVTVTNNSGSASATASWSVTASTPAATAPTVRFTSKAGTGSTKTFAWTTTGTVTSTRCSFDGGSQFSCSSPWTLTGLGRGSHRFTVYVAGPAGSASTWTSWYVF